MNPIRLRVLPALVPTNGREIELRNNAISIQWRYVTDFTGEYAWVDLVPLADLVGPSGPAIEMRADGSYIQYRVVGAVTWINLVPLSDLKGDQGDQGPIGPQGPSVVDGNKGDIVVSGGGTVWTAARLPIETRAWAIGSFHPVAAPSFILTGGYANVGDGGAALYKRVNSEPSHAGKFSILLADGSTSVWFEIASTVLNSRMFGSIGDGATDDTAAVRALALVAAAIGAAIDDLPGQYKIEPLTTIEWKSGGRFRGTFVVDKSKTVVPFRWIRDNPVGTVVSTSAWAASLSRGMTEVLATNALGKTLLLTSTETLIQRLGGAPYLKTEINKVSSEDGSLMRGLVCTYTSKANLTVTAYDPDKPIVISGLDFRVDGALGNGPDGLVQINRDYVTVVDPKIVVTDPSPGLVTGFYAYQCIGTRWIRPISRGQSMEGNGYGMQGSQTLAMVIEDAEMLDARHAFSGRNNTDCIIQGGHWSIIDDHWCENFTIRDCSVRTRNSGESALWIAGNGLHVENVAAFGGRGFLGIRLDTPQLGGVVTLRNIRCFARDISSGTYNVVAYTSPEGDFAPVQGVVPAARTDRPSLADVLSIEDVTVDANVDAWIVYSGGFYADHQSWGEINVRGANKSIGANKLGGVFGYKHATYATGRVPHVRLLGGNYAGAHGVYIVALDSAATRNWWVQVRDVLAQILRFSPFSVNILDVQGCQIYSVTNDDPTESIGQSLFTFADCDFYGGAVSSGFVSTGFFGCRFFGNYSPFPSAPGAMVGNVRGTSVTGLPTDIRTNVASPFA